MIVALNAHNMRYIATLSTIFKVHKIYFQLTIQGIQMVVKIFIKMIEKTKMEGKEEMHRLF